MNCSVCGKNVDGLPVMRHATSGDLCCQECSNKLGVQGFIQHVGSSVGKSSNGEESKETPPGAQEPSIISNITKHAFTLLVDNVPSDDIPPEINLLVRGNSIVKISPKGDKSNTWFTANIGSREVWAIQGKKPKDMTFVKSKSESMYEMLMKKFR